MTQLASPMVANEAVRSLGLDQSALEARLVLLERARKLYPNQGLHGAAEAFAWAHERGVQYLEAAPVLALVVPVASRARERAVAAWVRHVMAPLCERGAPLKEVLRAFDLSPPLRKLKGYGLVPGDHDVIRALSALPPEVVGQEIPEKPGAQKRWLSACREWREHNRRRAGRGDVGFAWAAVAMARAGVARQDVAHVADFRLSGQPFNPAWGWPRAAEEAQRWHARLTMERALKDTPFTPEGRIGFLGADVALRTRCGEFVFEHLRTPLALYEEGAAMRHCVATYVNMVIAGESHIFGVRAGGKRIATLELDRAFAIRQLKGPCNAKVAAGVAKAAAAFARHVAARARAT